MFRRSVLVKEPFLNMLRLFPTAQFPVSEVVNYCKTQPKVRRVTVFGSALETRHNPWSDIDLFVEGITCSDFFAPPVSVNRSLDIIRPDMISDDNEPLYREIVSKGVVVYERNPV